MFCDANGIKLFYTVVGTGRPVILLHGNGEDHTVFDELAERLKGSCTVYALDSRAHGQSSRDVAVGYDLMANDVVAFIKTLGIRRPVLCGFSDGGIVALLTALKEPELTGGIAVCGANLRPDGVQRSVLRFFRFSYFFKRSPLIKMMLTEPDIDSNRLKDINVPVLVCAGERDIILPEHTRLIADSIPGSRLHFYADAGHSSYVVHSDALYDELCVLIERSIK